MNTLKTLGLTAALSVLASSGAWAQAQTTTIKSDPANFQGDSSGASAQVGIKGPSSSMSYLDVEGAGNGTFATFGVADFIGNSIYDPNTGLAETIASINPSITLALSDTAFSQTRPTSINFYLSDSTVPLSTLKYQTSDTSQTAGVGSQLGDLYYLGSGVDTDLGGANAGGTLTYNLSLPAAAQSYLIQQLNADVNPAYGDTTTTPNLTDIRLVMTEADSSNPKGVASFGGSSNTGPELTLTTTAAVPEASTVVSSGVLLALGLVGLAIARRRRTA